MASGGTTGRRGVFVYGTEDWHEVLGGVAALDRRLHGHGAAAAAARKLATVVAGSPQHMTARMTRSVDVGVHRFLRLDARAAASTSWCPR